MATRTERRDAEAAAPAQKSFTISQFCERNHFSESFYYKIKKLGFGPRELRVLGKILITDEAEIEWLRSGNKSITEPETA